MTNVLERYGLNVFDTPEPHIPLEDVKLAFGAIKFQEFVDKGMHRKSVSGSAHPEDVKEFLFRGFR